MNDEITITIVDPQPRDTLSPAEFKRIKRPWITAATPPMYEAEIASSTIEDPLRVLLYQGDGHTVATLWLLDRVIYTAGAIVPEDATREEFVAAVFDQWRESLREAGFGRRRN